MANETRPALLTVVRGEPDELELAAVTAVLLALLGNGGAEGPEDPAETGGLRAGWRGGRPGYRSPMAWSRP